MLSAKSLIKSSGSSNPIDNLIKSSFHAGSITNALHLLNEHSKMDFTSRELYIITDAQHSSISNLQEHLKDLLPFQMILL